nr:immunoglobulin light chain junction region [Macaca mulatta]MOV75028.1 immunoglobulin light chain junction region [Macaca mulatta]MOV75131.1 immunoglobulin light chain junction region [Macaca mulatta]MOV75157.1 immunoglobulin light chain junction region [Macaca mulatta]MOV75747.1 immunoglobulin light chain junction region [Macaca mulatta]
CQSYITSPLTF